MKPILYFLVLLLTLSRNINGQKISVAPELDVRNDDMFALIGNIDNKILTFRSNDRKYILNIFDRNLNRYTTRPLTFEKKKIKIVSISNNKDSWVLVYSYLDKKKEIVNAYRYDNIGNRIDSNQIFITKRDILNRKFRFTESEDEKQLLLFRKKDNSSMLFIRINVDSLTKTYSKLIAFEDIKISTDFRKVLISNKGVFYTIFEKIPSIFSKSKHKIIVNSFNNELEEYKTININLDFKTNKFKSKYDNINEILNIAGTTTKSYSDKSVGYYIFKLNRNLELLTKIINKYKAGFLKDFYRLRNKKPKKYINNFYIKEILFRNDGGTILVFEKKEIISRQNNIRRNRSFRSNTDYLFEELGLISIHEDGQYFWHKIIPKYQFSSNDYGLYSSVFIFKTPSLLKLIFNDEIKDQNQIMMYSVNPLGKTDRRSIFSTELYDLNLAFEKSLQISGNKLIVPSYKNDRLKLVMIEFYTKP